MRIVKKIESENDYILYIIDTHFYIRLSSKNSTFYQNTIFSNTNIIYNRYTPKYDRNKVDKYLKKFD